MSMKIGGLTPAAPVPAQETAPLKKAEAQAPAPPSSEVNGAVHDKSRDNLNAAAARKRAVANEPAAASAAPPSESADSPFARDLERIARRNLPTNKVLDIAVPVPRGADGAPLAPDKLTMNDYNRAFAREMLRQNGAPSATDAEAEAFLTQYRGVTGRAFEILAESTDAVRTSERNGSFTIEVSVHDHATAAAGAENIRRRRAETADAIAAVRQKVSDNSELEQFVRGVGLGVKSGAVGTYEAVRHPVDTAEAVGMMIAHPADTYDKLKAALGDKWEEFLAADAPKKARMLGELTGETAVAIVGTKGVGAVGKTGAAALKATAPGRALAAEMAAATERLAAHPAAQRVTNAAETAGQKLNQAKETVKDEIGKTLRDVTKPVAPSVENLSVTKPSVAAVKPSKPGGSGQFESPVGRTNTGLDMPIPDRTPTPAASDLYLQSRHAEILANNMEKAGLGKKPEGYAAHHMVPRDLEKFPEAKNARNLLTELGLDTNDAANGVYLPQTKAAAAGTSAQYHPSTHTKQYFINVNKRLEKAVGEGGPTLEGQREAVIEELARIRRELENGTFPIR
jgi:hypothetical protein